MPIEAVSGRTLVAEALKPVRDREGRTTAARKLDEKDGLTLIRLSGRMIGAWMGTGRDEVE